MLLIIKLDISSNYERKRAPAKCSTINQVISNLNLPSFSAWRDHFICEVLMTMNLLVLQLNVMIYLE